MPASETMPATNPYASATVSASAGTGKTWLLVTRLIRLLLTGTRPDGILAVTFTRKAAAEMQTRLNARLLGMARCSEQELKTLLSEINTPCDEATLNRARTLYETLLSNPYTIRATTFHSFCQDILRRFPLEAGIAPGFELLEATADVRQAAWDALCADASNNPDGDIAQAMETLFDSCGGLANTTTALNSFLDHRSDWWAFTEGQGEGQTKPVQFATETLANQLKVSLEDEPEQDFFKPPILEALNEFVSLLQKHPGKKNDQALEALSIARDPEHIFPDRFLATTKAFLTQKGTPLARKESKVQEKKMGTAGQQRFLEIHSVVCSAIEETRTQIHAQEALRRISAWYRAGAQVLDHFQRLKTEQRALDFSDLEWRAYLLINHGDNVHWIQYKLDQRIDHLLIDEFQDTNPTQWRLILPLLQELAASEDERGRSVFLVGDNKQSIYRFRRADPELFNTAQSWLQANLNAVTQPLDVSWRSADAIMDFVNRVFGDGPLNQRLTQFSTHTTHHPDLWGSVEFLPLVEARLEPEDETDLDLNGETSSGLRNPLKTPRIIEQDQRHLEEGQLIAELIQQMITDKTLVGPADSARPMHYGDIIILLRNRTHAADYEQALREAGIPYVGANRGTLLESLETRDLVNLLELLIAPFNNLALANLLRSPLFDCSHDDLIDLAKQKNGNWMQRLATLAQNHITSNEPVQNKIQRAHTLLSQWQELAGKIPVHDLLDRIFCEGDVMNRYHSAYPPHLQHRVEANLTRFIELALEVDSGRHPTIGRFVSRLRMLRQQDQEAPDEGTPTQADSRVRLMTIHASKGLEAPVIFLADTANSGRDKKANQTVVDWPAQSARPNCFLLTGKKDSRDTFTASILDQHALAEAREDANLLYVAVTRARQFLFISGCQPNRGNDLGWYGLMSEQCRESDTENDIENLVTFQSGDYPKASQTAAPAETTPITIDQQLNQPLPHVPREIAIAPSYHAGAISNLSSSFQEEEAELLQEDARTRGIVIHRCLQLLCENSTEQKVEPKLLKRMSNEFGISHEDKELKLWVEEAQTVFNHPEFSHLFNADHYLSAYNEVPVQYSCKDNQDEQMVYGIVDRIVITEKEVFVIDYKTQRLTTPEQATRVSEYYKQQITLYCQGAQLLWPDKTVHGFLLLTHEPQLLPLDT